MSRSQSKETYESPPLQWHRGAVSIMQCVSSAGSHIPTSTTGLPMRSVTSPALLPAPMESGQHQPPSSLPQVRQEVVYQQGLLYKCRGRILL